ncbi:nucleoside-diphosphate-sugar epimerase [Sarocladium strictum]
MKIFLTGATGYIGGDALFLLSQQHPDSEFSLLVRSEDKAKKVQEQYPNARIVLGGLDDSKAIREEAAWADIVVHTADSSDHAQSARDIAQGLVDGHSPERPGVWLHLGGTGILTYFDSEVKKTFGEPDDKVFDDLDGVDELVNLPAEAFHRDVDEIVLKAGTDHADRVKTAIICPPTIYGQGRGPVSGRGRQVYQLTSFILREGYVPRIGRGLARWNNVHVHDLSTALAQLVDAGTDLQKHQQSADLQRELWGAHGYFLTENGEHTWGDLAVQIGQEAHKQGLLPSEPETREYSVEEAVKSPAGFEAASWGMNSRAKALRARKFLNWEPKQHSLEDEIPTLVKSEQARISQGL